jgi:citrate/tricarballylate utilization protein
MLVGVAALCWLKTRANRAVLAAEMLSADKAFLALLAAVAASGLALRFLRETPAIGPVLTIHLGLVLAFFLVLPAGKFVHAVYRAAALFRAAIEAEAKKPSDSSQV